MYVKSLYHEAGKISIRDRSQFDDKCIEKPPCRFDFSIRKLWRQHFQSFADGQAFVPGAILTWTSFHANRKVCRPKGTLERVEVELSQFHGKISPLMIGTFPEKYKHSYFAGRIHEISLRRSPVPIVRLSTAF